MTTYTIALELTKEVQRVKRPVCVCINENETQTIKAQLTRYFKPCTVECDKAQLHMLRDDGTWSHVDATCTGDSVECAIKAVQLGKTAQNACAYFFFQKGTKTETTESFQLRVERAAIDTEASDAFFDTTMNAIATKWGAYENAAEAQERARQSAESKRTSAEQERVSAEQARVAAEQKRVSAEQERDSAESERKKAELARKQSEQERESAESDRDYNEDNRTNAESNRLDAEQARAQAETARQSSESTRVTAEQSRQSRFNEMLDAAQNVKFRILSASEVDSEGKPTITGSPGIIYLVKAQSSEETKANHYTEWIFLENRWELFGSTAPTADPIEVDDIDKLANGTTIAGNRVLNATGLSALWGKLQARLQSVSSDVQTAQSTANAAKQASASNASSIQSLSSKQSTFEQQASNQLRALRTWAESTLESKMQERYNAGFNAGKQEGGEDIEGVVFSSNVSDFEHVLKRKSTSDGQAFVMNLKQDTKSSMLDKDPERVMRLIIATYGDAFFKHNWGEGEYWNKSLWLEKCYCRMNNANLRSWLKYYNKLRDTADTIAKRKDAFYSRFGTSKLAEIANNGAILFSLSNDDFMNACYAYICDGTRELKVSGGVFHEICDKLGLPKCKLRHDSYYQHYVFENEREDDSYSFKYDVYDSYAYKIVVNTVDIFGRADNYYKQITVAPDSSTAHKLEGFEPDFFLKGTQCTLTLKPFAVS